MKAFLVLVALVLAGGVALMYSGMVDVGASKPDPPVVRWVLSTVSDHSVERHAKGIVVPALGSPQQLHAGFLHYREQCAVCHGAPGAEQTALSKGLNPRAPKFSRGTDLAPEELFWITKNGIRMTGMPAWGATEGDEDMWATVAFVQQLEKVTPEQYREMSRAAGNTGAEATAAAGKKKP